jgi:hypothetical protein
MKLPLNSSVIQPVIRLSIRYVFEAPRLSAAHHASTESDTAAFCPILSRHPSVHQNPVPNAQVCYFKNVFYSYFVYLLFFLFYAFIYLFLFFSFSKTF